ncbi:hypothetical protein Taro_018720 [Colocasia esculenta]|uniref:Uncharacterized protein n=1 Tax=Colocasia esculenta TaxID=4460 RepID=A0A843UX22_COLES|nr:hypothetical protein [Colocasia esculenta]
MWDYRTSITLLVCPTTVVPKPQHHRHTATKTGKTSTDESHKPQPELAKHELERSDATTWEWTTG